jgi:hypothetical protein
MKYLLSGAQSTGILRLEEGKLCEAQKDLTAVLKDYEMKEKESQVSNKNGNRKNINKIQKIDVKPKTRGRIKERWEQKM